MELMDIVGYIGHIYNCSKDYILFKNDINSAISKILTETFQ